MKRNRGFKMGRKFVKVSSWLCRRRSISGSNCRSLNQQESWTSMSKLCEWARSLKDGAKGLCSSRSISGDIRAGNDDPFGKPSVSVPKGHLAVYVGEKEDDACRIVVPVIYFNHPLFGELLRQAEKVYGFDQPGGIQIPCRISEFEYVETRIAGGGDGRGRRR